ncbi:peptide deformylase [Candidatus Saccharibacteria bacterium]|nr:MAG: peptide deformylase [Candidatus Saccharibacteria bacterium]PID98837.1 MAG: peptide deformylase [Candidatus Saccharibacteria bacterium]
MNRQLITLPHADLRQRSKQVGFVGEAVKQLIADMEQATLAWEDGRAHEVGVALAAVQIDELWRVVIIRNNFENKSDRTFQVFINPKITKYEGEIVSDYEGCLSIKNVYGLVPRHSKVRVKALNKNGKEIRLTAEGFLARVFQHEIDHTNGIVFIDHIKDDPNAFFTLTNEGKLEAKNYEQDIKNNPDLWD